MALSLNSHVRTNEDVLFQDLQGEAVLLNLKTGIYLGLDPVGTRIWQLLQQDGLLSKVVESIVAEYQVTEERCGEELLTLVAEMENHQLVTVDG